MVREPAPSDRRATLVGLTEDGRRTSSAIHQIRRDQAGEFSGSLSATDQVALRRILARPARDDDQT